MKMIIEVGLMIICLDMKIAARGTFKAATGDFKGAGKDFKRAGAHATGENTREAHRKNSGSSESSDSS